MKQPKMSKRAWIVAASAVLLVLLLALSVFAETAPSDELEGQKSASLVSYQVTKNQDGVFSVRLITGIPSLHYRSCGYDVIVTVIDADGEEVMTGVSNEADYVYSSIYGGETEYAICDISDYDYASLATVTNIPADSQYVKLEIRPYVTVDGGKILYSTAGALEYTGDTDADGYPAFAYTSYNGTDLPFVPVMRFVATSDVHIKSATGTQATRLANIMTQLREYYADPENNGGHENIDALLAVGDITNDGTEEQLEIAKGYFDTLLEGTDTELVITMGNHDWNAYNDQDLYDNTVALEQFESYFGDMTKMVKIGGYYFISIVADDLAPSATQAFRGWGWGYSEKIYAELEEMLKTAVADTGMNKPIFLVKHIGNVDTVLGTDKFAANRSVTATNDLASLENKYPNLVMLSGHSHHPIYDEFSIHQKHFTSLNTGTLGSSSKSYLNGETVTMLASSHVNGVWLVEVDALGRTKIRIWDGNTNGFYGETYMVESYKQANFKYTEDRFDSDDIFFAKGAKITSYDVFSTTASVAFLPVPEESLMARAYEVVLKDAEGTVLKTDYIFPEYYIENYETPFMMNYDGLVPNTQYTVSVTAITGGYGVQLDVEAALRSEPIVGSFTTASGASVTGADLIDIVIYPELKTVGKKSEQNLNVGLRGAPAYAYDETVGMNVVKLDGTTDTILRFECQSLSDTLVNGFTFETLVRVDEMPTENVALVGAMQSGGYGLFAYADGTLRFRMVDNKTNDNGTALTRNITLGNYTIGAYYHVLVTFDGTTCTGYLNGEMIGSATLEEGFKLPATEGNRNLVVGADTNSGTKIQTPSKCTVGILRLYSDVLDEAAIEDAYKALATKPVADLINLAIDSDNKTVENKSGSSVVLTVKGTPEYTYDEELGRDVVSLDGASGNALHFAYKTVSEAVEDGFTLETLIRVDEAPAESGGLVSGMHKGGFGLFALADGTLQLQIYDTKADASGSTIRKLDTTYTVGTYYHVTVVMDGSTCVLYVNGQAVDSMTMNGFVIAPTAANRNLVVGADSHLSTGIQTHSKCTIGALRFYSGALSAAEVADAFGRIDK